MATGFGLDSVALQLKPSECRSNSLSLLSSSRSSPHSFGSSPKLQGGVHFEVGHVFAPDPLDPSFFASGYESRWISAIMESLMTADCLWLWSGSSNSRRNSNTGNQRWRKPSNSFSVPLLTINMASPLRQHGKPSRAAHRVAMFPRSRISSGALAGRHPHSFGDFVGSGMELF